jgi:hypothetical protein
MNRMDLVTTIIFENDETFKNLSMQKCKMILDASGSYAVKNKNIRDSLRRFQSYYEQKLLCNKICLEMSCITETLLSQSNMLECD